MDTSRFIATKVAFSSNKSLTKWIIRIAITAVALSLAVMIIAFAMISGFKKEISDKIFGFWGHIHITDANISRSIESIPIRKNQDFLFDLDTFKTIKYQSPLKVFGAPLPGRFKFRNVDVNIKSVYPYALAPAIINSKEDFEGVIVRGLGEGYDWSQLDPYIKEGRSIQYSDVGSSDEVLISTSISKRLGLNISDNFIINIIKDGQQIKRKVEIVGIYNTGLEEYDKKFIVADLKKVQELLQWNEDQVAGFEIVLNEIYDMQIINEVLYMDILPSRLYSETIRDKFPNIFEWLDLQDLNGVVILLLMIIVALINMVTGILILIIERSKMIGTLKSLGMKDWGIRKIFLYYAGYIVTYGLIFGNIIGLGICFLQKWTGFIKLDETNYYLELAPVNINLITILLLNVIAFVVILSFLVLPTYIIAKLKPVKILRFQ